MSNVMIILPMRCIVLKRSSGWVIASSRRFSRGAQACTDNAVSDSMRCSIETRDPVDSHTARCDLASLNDLRILMMCTT